MIRVGRDDSQNIAGTPTLFWYDESYTSIYKYDEESGTQLLQEWALPGDIKGFQGFQRVKSGEYSNVERGSRVIKGLNPVSTHVERGSRVIKALNPVSTLM